MLPFKSAYISLYCLRLTCIVNCHFGNIVNSRMSNAVLATSFLHGVIAYFGLLALR
jgi:hypothetical protein